MATNKNAMIRYQVLDRCFRNPGRKYFIEDLVKACDDALLEYRFSSDGVKKRQVFEDIKYMESAQGWSIPLERHKDGKKVFYRYSDLNFSINNQLINETEANQLKETLQVLSRFKGMPQFEWIEELGTRLRSALNLNNNSRHVIEFDQNQYLKGLEFITPLYNAIIYTRPLIIRYFPFNSFKESEYTIHPYYLKQYNNRWFLFGWNEDDGFLMNLALDRIQSLKELDHKFISKEINFTEYFENIVGVTVPLGGKAEKINILVSTDFWPYLKTKPIHGSQKVIGKEDGFVNIELELIINYELTALLFSYGDRIRVQSPDYLKEKLIAIAKAMILNYE